MENHQLHKVDHQTDILLREELHKVLQVAEKKVRR